MALQEDILNYLGIIRNTSKNLEYIYKLINILNKYTYNEIEAFYLSYNCVNSEILVNEKNCVSINYILVNNPTFLNITSDILFVRLLVDYNLDLVLEDDLEMRLVNLINDNSRVHIANISKLLRYVTKYTSKLIITNITSEFISDVHYLMKYSGTDLEIIKNILQKCTDDSFKREVLKYIDTQGILNSLLFYMSIVLCIKKICYINNINVDELIICRRHFFEYVKDKIILQRYIYKTLIEGNLTINNCNTIDLIKKDKNIIEKYNSLREKFIRFDIECFIWRYPDLINLQIYFVNSRDLTDIFTTEELLYLYVTRKTNISVDEIKYVLDAVSERKLEFLEILLRIQSRQSTKEADNILQYIRYNYSTVISENKKLSAFLKGKKMIGEINAEDKVLTCVDKDLNKYVDLYLQSYDLIHSHDIIIQLINKHKQKVVDILQKNILRILDEGFFEETYFNIIQNIYNKMLPYSKTMKQRRNNDIIIIQLAKYCAIFEKNMHIGNVKKM